MSEELQLLRQRIERLSPKVGTYRERLLHCVDVASLPDNSLALARSVAESLVKEVLSKLGIPVGAALDACLKKLEEPAVMSRGLVPAEIITLLHAARVLGNKATHGVLKIEVSAADVALVLRAVLRVLEWYFAEFSRGPRLSPLFREETLPVAPTFSAGPIELCLLDAASLQELGEALTDGPLIHALLNGPRAAPLAMPLTGIGTLQLVPRNGPVSEEALWDLQSELRILTTHREYVRLLEERLNRGGLGTEEPAFHIERARRQAEVEQARQRVAEYLGVFIVSASLTKD